MDPGIIWFLIALVIAVSFYFAFRRDRAFKNEYERLRSHLDREKDREAYLLRRSGDLKRQISEYKQKLQGIRHGSYSPTEEEVRHSGALDAGALERSERECTRCFFCDTELNQSALVCHVCRRPQLSEIISRRANSSAEQPSEMNDSNRGAHV